MFCKWRIKTLERSGETEETDFGYRVLFWKAWLGNEEMTGWGSSIGGGEYFVCGFRIGGAWMGIFFFLLGEESILGMRQKPLRGRMTWRKGNLWGGELGIQRKGQVREKGLIRLSFVEMTCIWGRGGWESYSKEWLCCPCWLEMWVRQRGGFLWVAFYLEEKWSHQETGGSQKSQRPNVIISNFILLYYLLPWPSVFL